MIEHYKIRNCYRSIKCSFMAGHLSHYAIMIVCHYGRARCSSSSNHHTVIYPQSCDAWFYKNTDATLSTRPYLQLLLLRLCDYSYIVLLLLSVASDLPCIGEFRAFMLFSSTLSWLANTASKFQKWILSMQCNTCD